MDEFPEHKYPLGHCGPGTYKHSVPSSHYWFALPLPRTSAHPTGTTLNVTAGADKRCPGTSELCTVIVPSLGYTSAAVLLAHALGTEE